MASEPMVSAALVRRILAKLVARGIVRDALMAEAGLTPAALGLTRVRMPWAVVEDLFEAGERLSGDDRIGFHVGKKHDFDAAGILELVFFASGTLGDAVRRGERLMVLLSDAERGCVVPDPPRVRYELRRPARRAGVHLHEHALAMVMDIFREATKVRLEPVEVRFTHPRACDPAAYEAYFGCPVRFGAGVTEMVLRPGQLELPLPTANPWFARHFERQAEEELAALSSGRSVGERLRDVLEEDLAALRLGESSLESSAARLRTSARTLQRALGAEGTTFASVMEGVRREAAERLLLAGTDIAEVSWRLGYAEPPVFHRAFKRWTGETPEGFRGRRVVGQ